MRRYGSFLVRWWQAGPASSASHPPRPVRRGADGRGTARRPRLDGRPPGRPQPCPAPPARPAASAKPQPEVPKGSPDKAKP